MPLSCHRPIGRCCFCCCFSSQCGCLSRPPRIISREVCGWSRVTQRPSNEERETGDRSSSFLTIPLSVVSVHLPLSVSTPHRAERRCHRHDTSRASQSDWRQRQRPETISSSLAWEDWQRLVEGNCLCILSSQALSHQQGREH
jgi:hypothetical protein